ncbi:radical SAM protein [Streptomyces sp. HU2014]|uniref:4Fe-4S single cluster domain-containing protein n=1 Tax=Streptomyces sp. HU2014 TaxID=2939414 RepID=UPI00200D7026|nr:4Fe-4S single cluster domain-containing protein [Streptomyces sp. HU2014]UQI45789.1 radical SAM protein [Streptomyces sp. HU2014]
MRIKINGTHFPLETLGPGRRLGVWFQGCPLACAGCMSRHTWAAEGGRESSVRELLDLWREALDRGADGLTVSGGEPLEQAPALAGFLAGAALLRSVAERAGGARRGPRADFLVYTGYEQDEWDPPRLRALRHADAVVAGRFRIAEPTALVWRGSANQRLLPRTALGRARYAPHLRRRVTGPAVQVVVEAGREPGEAPAAHLLGVPARGELAFYERWLGERGLRLKERSWRP